MGTIVLCLFTVALATAQASNIVLTSIEGGTFTYALQLVPGETASFSTGRGLSLSGMAGVTSSMVSGPLGVFTAAIPTDSSASLVNFLDRITLAFANIGASDSDVLEWKIQSSRSTIGLVIGVADSNEGRFSTGVLGPVADPKVPEPATAGLVLLGLAAASRALRGRSRHRRERNPQPAAQD
ncbi:MAG: PEP-CTERM sorting domain-containing protein [Bryobacteraceae bacterium]